MYILSLFFLQVSLDPEEERLNKLLEEQKRKREMIQKQKEIRRQQQAEKRRQELLKKLADQGKQNILKMLGSVVF